MSGARHPLERLLSPLEPTPLADPGTRGSGVQCRAGSGPPVWLKADGWRLYARPGESASGEELARFALPGGGTVSAARDGDRVTVPFSLAEAYANYVSEAWSQASAARRVPERGLDVFYRVKRLIPRRAQLAARRALIRWQGVPEFPAWPFDDSVGRLLRFHAHCAMLARDARELRFRWFWPGDNLAALVLTHDVESAAGLRGSLEIARMEEERGLRSSFNIVADWYPIDRGIVRELHGRGFEIGVHGVHHDRSMFASRPQFEAQQPALRAAVRELGAGGFRSPATHRVHEWLGELPVDYDCTVPLSDPYEPQPGGCCSVWPFFIGSVVELPWTLPQDHTMFTLLRREGVELWLEQTAALERARGLVQCVTHPDPGYLGDPDKRARYGEFLDALADRPRLWRTLPREVAAWWRRRDAGETGEAGVARLDPRTGEVELAPVG